MPFKPQSWSPYESLPLSPPSTPSLRIFRIAPGNPGDPLHGELSVEIMRSVAGNYRALSYVWGNATEQRWILVNGKPFHVHPNLYEALHGVRNPTEVLPLWVDALCIEQNNEKEKNHQVGMMGQIYYNAKEVLVWLGPAADDSDLLFDRLSAGKFSGSSYSKEQFPADQALKQMLERDYWQRAWTIQEFALAKEVVLYCGSKSMKAATFIVWAMLRNMDTPFEKSRIWVFTGHRNKAESGQFHHLEQLLLNIGKPECSDIRDRIFA